MMNKELYLIIPPLEGMVTGLHVGFNYIRNYLKTRAPELPVTVVDWAMKKEHDLKELVPTIPTGAWAGITTVSASYQVSLKLARMLKERGNPVILGGPHAAKQAKVVLEHHDYVDYVAIGEGERTLYDLFHHSIPEVSGLAYRSNGGVTVNPERTLSKEELSAIPFHLDYLARDARGRFPTIPGMVARYSASRGCTGGCTFCAANRYFVAKKVPFILEDLQYILKQGFVHFIFEDNFFGADAKSTGALCDGIVQNGLDFTWECQTRVDIGEKEGLLEKMKAAGCTGINLGAENFDQNILRYMNKTRHPERYAEQTVRTVHHAFQAGIQPVLMMQMGLEPENEETREVNMAQLRRLAGLAGEHRKSLMVYFSTSVAYPGTVLYEGFRKKYGLAEDFFEKFTAWEADNRDAFIRDHCPHGVGGFPLGLIDTEKLRANAFQIADEKYENMKNHHEAIQEIGNIELLAIKRYLL